MRKYSLFISYSRKDKDIAVEICHILDEYKKHYDFEYFFDCEEITSKHDYIERISSAISQSKAILFLASKNSLESEFCLKELLFADKLHIYIHQYRLDRTEYPKPIQLLLCNYHYREASSFSKNEMVREVLIGILNQEIKAIPTFKTPSKNIKLILIGICLPLVLYFFSVLNKIINESDVIYADSLTNGDTIINTNHNKTEEQIIGTPQSTENIAPKNNNNNDDDDRHLSFAGVPMNMDINSFANRLIKLDYQLIERIEKYHFYKFEQGDDIIRVHWDEQNNKVYLVEVICQNLTEDSLNDVMYTFADEYGIEPQPFNEWAEGITFDEGAILFGLNESKHIVIMYLDKINSIDYRLL